MKLPNHHGFSLIELLMVCCCLLLVLLPGWEIFRSSTQSSLKGVGQAEATIEGRLILRMIHDDLKSSCLESDSPRRDFASLLVETSPAPENAYSFLRFPLAGDSDVSEEKKQNAVKTPRFLSRVTYRVRKNPNGSPFFYLEREEIFPPAHPEGKKYPNGKRKILTQRLIRLFIEKKWIQTKRNRYFPFFRLTLQLADLRLSSIPSAGSGLFANPLILEFFDVCYSEAYGAFWKNQSWTRNAHSPLVSP